MHQHRTSLVGSDGKIIRLQCGRPGCDPWVGKILRRRKWQPTPLFLPGESHGQRSLAGYIPRGLKESDKSEPLSLPLHVMILKSKLTVIIKVLFKHT